MFHSRRPPENAYLRFGADHIWGFFSSPRPYYFRMEPTWEFMQRSARLGFMTALLSVLFAAPVAGCSGFQSDWSTPVRGVILDSNTKQPIPHATVFVDRDPPSPSNQIPRQNETRDDRGKQLTTGADGRFLLADVSYGSHFFNVEKDGYISATIRSRPYQRQSTPLFSSYEVRVGPAVGEIRLFLTPAAKIQGRVISDAKQPMKNVYLRLYSSEVEDGRTMWRLDSLMPTDEKGVYSFANLAPGDYVVMSDWIFDNDPNLPRGTDCPTTKFMPTGGFPPAANPGVLDFSEAQPIHLAAGHAETANLTLPHQQFHAVTWLHNGELSPRSFRTLRDRNGRNLHPASPPESHCGRPMPETVEAGPASPPQNMLINGRETIHLPDGDYTLLTGSGFPKDKREAQSTLPRLGYYARFTVAGKPLTLSYPARPARSEPAVTLRMQVEGTPGWAPLPDVAGSALWLTRADPLPESSRFVLNRSQENQWVFYLEAGSYWVHAGDLGYASPMTNSCIASVTAGGADMLKEPLVVGVDGEGPQLEMTTSDHCGTLDLNYRPADSNQERYGVSRSFYGYLVPAFSGFETVHSFLFEPGRPQAIKVGNLVPGHYKFYVSLHERSFAFREDVAVPADLAPGQDIWIKSDENVDVSVTDPQEE